MRSRRTIRPAGNKRLLYVSIALLLLKAAIFLLYFLAVMMQSVVVCTWLNIKEEVHRLYTSKRTQVISVESASVWAEDLKFENERNLEVWS